jgi:peptidyl-prolyl cis-trans isomerase C
MSANGFDDPSFRQSLARAIAAAWMRDRIIETAPTSGEQVHARQIRADTQVEANAALGRLQAGEDFASLAAEFDPVSEGELGWFSRGVLLDKALEDAVFGLEPGQYSSVIETAAGFHILQLIERDPERLLSPEARLALQAQLLEQWIQEQRSQGDIQIFN